MNGRTSKLIRKAAKQLHARGVVPNAKKAARRVRNEYNKKTPQARAIFRVAVANMITTPIPEVSLNKLGENVS